MTDEVIQNIIKNGNRNADQVVYDSDPEKLVKKIKDMILVYREETIRRSNAWQDG